MLYQIYENGLHFVSEMVNGQPIYFLHMGMESMTEEPAEILKNSTNIQEIQVTGESTRTANHMDASPIGTYPGYRMFYNIENCSIGGMRMDYALLSRYSIQSTSNRCLHRYQRYEIQGNEAGCS